VIRHAAAATLAVALLAGCAVSPSGPGGPPLASADENARRILVMVEDPDIDRLDLRGARSGPYRQGHAYPGTSSRVARVLSTVADDFGLKPVDGWPMQSLDIHCAVFEVAPDASIDAVIAGLAADERIESVQRMQEFAVQESGGRGAWDDPYLSLQRSFEDLGITRAHRWSTGRGVRVAVVDTGIDVHHPDLRGQTAEARSFMPGGASAPDRHGTAAAGVIASVADNRQGIVGVAPGARLLALQACAPRSAGGRGTCTSFSLARALDHAITAQSDVVNLSLGGPRDALLERLLGKAIERNMVVVAARGDGGGEARFPSAVRGVIAVGSARTPADAGQLTASGLDVLTLVPPDGYDYLSGSSIAAAHVSGIVALLLERDPQLRASDVERLLVRTARPVGQGGPDYRRWVNACGALAEVSGAIQCDADGRAARAAAAASPLETH
jgi:hypothetical protein